MGSLIKQSRELPIGVFDSGMGGLTVLSALQEELPNERFIYLGDTARLPYGTKSGATVKRYTQHVAELLYRYGIKFLVIACNTATTYGLSSLKQSHPDLPILGVIEPGAQKACQLSKSGHISVLATEGTIKGQAYEYAIHQLKPSAKVIPIPCSLFVSLVEEGFTTGLVAEEVSKHYLQPLIVARNSAVDCVLLGCTHFPVLTPVLKNILPQHIQLVDSAHTTALEVKHQLQQLNLLQTEPLQTDKAVSFFVTDSPERFIRIGSQILSKPIGAQQVELVDILLEN